MSSGDIFIAAGATGRALVGRLTATSESPMPIEVSTGTVAIDPHDAVQVADLGDTEAMTASGVIIPGEIIIDFVGPFGSGIGQIEVWDVQQHEYAIDTPVLPPSIPSPELFSGVKHVTLGGMPSVCGYGNALGPNQVAGIWCRAKSSVTWRLAGAFKNALSIGSLIPDRNPNEKPIAIDVAGTAYVPTPAAMFSPTVTPEINSGCMPPCASFNSNAIPPSGSDVRTVMVGSSAQVVAMHDRGGSISLQTVDSVQAALFGDERSGGMMSLRFQASAFAPDGSMWIGTKDPILLKLTPDLSSAARICLPRDASGMPITSIVADTNGRLILGITPAFLGFGRWR